MRRLSRARRGALLTGLALVLGGLAASDVAGREAALEEQLGPPTQIVVARRALAAGHVLRARDLAGRTLPARYAPPDSAASPADLVGRPLAIALAAGAPVSVAHVAADGGGPAGAPVRSGERAIEVVAAASPELVVAGARVDVLITHDAAAELALQDVEVLAAAAPPAGGPADAAGARVAATLRVTLRQAVLLTAAASFAREIRLLPRAPGDRRRAAAVAVGKDLR